MVIMLGLRAKQPHYGKWYCANQWGNALEVERVMSKFPSTHPCFAIRKILKDLASEKRKFKLCKQFWKVSSLSLYLACNMWQVVWLSICFVCYNYVKHMISCGLNICMPCWLEWSSWLCHVTPNFTWHHLWLSPNDHKTTNEGWSWIVWVMLNQMFSVPSYW